MSDVKWVVYALPRAHFIYLGLFLPVQKTSFMEQINIEAEWDAGNDDTRTA